MTNHTPHTIKYHEMISRYTCVYRVHAQIEVMINFKLQIGNHARFV